MPKPPRPFVGPERKSPRSIACRRCARDCSYRVDGTWRHDDDGSLLVDRLGDPDSCPTPDVVHGHER